MTSNSEREEESKRQVIEYNKLKDKMKAALRDLEIRENQLLEQERRVRTRLLEALSQVKVMPLKSNLTLSICMNAIVSCHINQLYVEQD